MATKAALSPERPNEMWQFWLACEARETHGDYSREGRGGSDLPAFSEVLELSSVTPTDRMRFTEGAAAGCGLLTQLDLSTAVQ
jgi:hypothetical protein